MILLYQKIKEYGLGRLYAYVLQNNPSKNLPYHGNSHMEMVAWVATLGGVFYGLTDEDMKILITAALVHDFDHSGSGKDDDINIVRAILGYSDYIEKTGNDNVDVNKVNDLIMATRYPYTRECGTLTISQQILRDADILQGLFCQNYINGITFGIAQEANIPNVNMINGQEAFLTSTKFCTNWATEIAKNKLPDVLTKVNLVKEFFNS
jgi:hypothetical protein